MHRALKWLAIVAVVLVAVAALLVGVLHTPPGRRLVLSRVTQLLTAQGIDVSMDQLRYNLLDLSIDLRNVTVRSPRGGQDPPFATVRRLRADISLVDLLRGKYVVESATVEDADVHYLVDAAGDNVPRPPGDPDAPSEPVDYLIASLGVSKGAIRYENRVQQVDLHVPLTSLTLRGDRATGRHAVSLQAGEGGLQAQGRTVELTSLSADVDLGKDDVEVAHVTLEAEGSRVELRGTVDDFADPALDVRVLATLAVARAARLAGMADPASGQVTVDATATGPAFAPQVDARIEGRGLRVRALDATALDAHLAYDGNARQVTAHQFDARAPWGSIAGSGAISLSQAPSHVRLRVSGVDVQKLMRGLGMPQVVATRVTGQADASWPGLNYAEATGTADLSMTPVQARVSESTMPLGGRVRVRGNSGRATAQLTGIRAAGARLDGQVALAGGERLGGNLRADVADLGATVAAAERFLGRPAGSILPAQVSGGVTATAALGGTLARPSATASVDAPALAVEQAGTLALHTTVRYTPEQVGVDALDLTWGEARAHATGRVELAAGQPMDLRFQVDALPVPSLLVLAGQDPATAQGTLTLSGAANGTLANPRVTATLRGASLVAAGEPLGTLGVDVALTGRQVTLGRFVLDKPQPGGDGRLTATGGYHLDTRAYAIDLQSSDLQLVNLALPDGRPVRGDVVLAGKGAGTVEAPAGTLKLSLDALRLAEHELGNVRLDAAVTDARANLNLVADRFGLRAHAVVDVAAPYPATVEARLAHLDLAALPVTMPTPIAGQLTANVTASLELAHPEQAQVTATLEDLDGTVNGQPVAIDGPAVLAMADQRLTIERLRIVAQDSTVAIDGDLPMNARTGQGELTIDARGNMATLSAYAPPAMGLTAGGTIQLTGTLRGNLELLDPDLRLRIDDGTIATPQLGDQGITAMSLRANVASGMATLERLTAAWSGATIDTAAEFPLDLAPALPVEIPRRGGPARVRATVAGLDVAGVPGAPDGMSGRISVNLDASAERPDLAALTGSLTFPELRVAFRGLELAQRQPSTIRMAGGTVTIEQFALAGSAGTLNAQGTVGLLDARPLDVTVDGAFDTAAASSLTDAVRTEGQATLNFTATGTMAAPALAGVVALDNVTAVVDEPELVAQGLSARLELAGDRVTLTSLGGQLNGGTLKGSGSLAFRDGAFRDVNVQLVVTGMAFEAPLDLRSLSDTTLEVSERDGDLLVNGKVLIREAGLTGDINFDTGLLATLTQPRSLDLTDDRNAMLERVRFNVQVQTATPIVVDNNMARAEVRTNLRVLGTPYETGLTGTLTVLGGGEITLNERRYEVERAAITFLEERRIVPFFDLRLNTAAGNYDVILSVRGEPGDTQTTLTSDPALPEPDIMALLVTGRTLDQMRGEEGDIAREQVLSYIAGRVGSQLGRGIERATGLSEVRLEPNLIANEADPSARLTVAQNLTDDLTLVYSTDLADSNDQIWVARYDVTRRFQTNAVRQSDGSYRLDFRHDVRFGGRPSPRRLPRSRPTVASVQVAADGVLGEAELLDRFGLDAGDTFDYFTARNRVADIEDELQKRGRLQARVKLERRPDGNTVGLLLRVDSGPMVELRYEGMSPPSDVDEEVRRQWNRGVFDSQRVGDAIEVLRGWLIEKRYLTAEIAHSVEDTGPKSRQVVFTITPNTRFERIELQFAGASGVDPATLDAIVDEQDLERELFTDPTVVTELLQRYYREQGYLSAEIDAPRYEYEGSVARAVLDVREGPRFTIGTITVSGNRVVGTQTLRRELPLVEGDPFLPRAAARALERTRALYWRRAYNDVRPDYSLAVDRKAGRVDVALEIEEGPQSVIAELNVEGNQKTSDRLVHQQMEVEPQEPLDLAALGRSRRNLYDTGAFSMVDITREPVTPEPAPGENTVASNPEQEPQQADAAVKPVRVNVRLREVQPLQLRYGASYDTERGLGGILDVSNHNTLGKARMVGLSARYDARLREGRLYMSQPSLLYWPVQTTGSLYYREERNAESALADPFNVDRYGVSIQQERQLANDYVWSYGYRYERARKFSPMLSVPGETIAVSPLTSTFAREARDDVLDATRGSFSSHGLSYSPSWLGADAAYLKYYGQYFHYFPLQPERRKRFTHEVLRPRFVYATGVRLGLSRGIGRRVPETERFYAGGSTSLRGFEQNAVGPVGVDRVPTGGEALLVLNNEIRFPLIGVVDGVGFLDIGNVFDRLSDFSFGDLRETAGVGLRVRTPWFLVRGDYGVVLDRRAGEQRSRFYFSIGQAF